MLHEGNTFYRQRCYNALLAEGVATVNTPMMGLRLDRRCRDLIEEVHHKDMPNDEGGEVGAEDAVELGSLEQRLVNTWIGPVSEEVGYNAATCAANVGVQQADCTGQYCDNNYLYCAALPAGRTTIGSGFWTAYISEENPNNNIYCQTGGVGTPVNGIVDGIRATGQYSDNISLHCREMNQAAWTTIDRTMCGFHFSLFHVWTPITGVRPGIPLM